MEFTTIGAAGTRVSRLALGCWQFSGDATWGAQDRKDSIATVHAALEAGINFFDTAEMYGDGLSETILGEALQGRRQEAIIASKVSQLPLTGDTVCRACEASLKRLKTDWIDLYQVHFWDRQTPIDECLKALLDLRDAGKVRTIGTCNSGMNDLSQMMALVKPATNQMPYSLLWRAIEFAIQPRCLALGVGILAYSPLAQGLLTGRFKSPEEVPVGRARTRLFSKTRPQTRHGEPGKEQEAFAAVSRIRTLCAQAGIPMAAASLGWLLSQPSVVAAIVGARSPRQIEENAQSVSRPFPRPLFDELSRATEALKEELGPNPDPWQAESRVR